MSALDNANAPVQALLEALEAHGREPRPCGDEWSARCPGPDHSNDDRNPSLSIGNGEDGCAVVYCHTGCDTKEVLAAIGFGLADLYPPRKRGNGYVVEDTHTYVDESNNPLFCVQRRRNDDGSKDFRQYRISKEGERVWNLKGAKRVLYRLPRVIKARGHQPVWVVEGEKDVHALEKFGVVATTNPGGAGKWKDEYSNFLEGTDVVIVADRDKAGRKHAAKVAQSLEGIATSIRVVEAAVGSDAYDHLIKAGKTLDEFTPLDEEVRDGELDDEFDLLEEEGTKGKKSAATRIVEMARRLYRFGFSNTNEAFAIPKQGPQVVSTLKGSSKSLRAQLASEFFKLTGRAASQQALADALNIIEGDAQQADNHETLYLRVATTKDNITQDDILWLDLGSPTGAAVRITPLGWSIEQSPPVLFKRTVLIGELPEPVSGGSLDELWQWLNVESDDRPLLVAWLVAALYSEIPHPILGLFGEQGTGKTTAMRIIVSAIDATPVPTRKPPSDIESWITAAASSWVAGLDNLSAIPPWLSDSLCRAVTGDADIHRQKYTNADLVLFEFRRCVIFNGIDLGGLRGDLSERLVPIHLRRITEDERLRETELQSAWKEAHPRVLGAILDLAVRVAQVMPSLKLDRRPRMADFAEILVAVDMVLGTKGYARYLDKQSGLAAETLTGDDFVTAIEEELAGEVFEGTSADLLKLLTKELERPPTSWPKGTRAVTQHLRRQAPLMRTLGWTVNDDGAANKRCVLRWTITPPTRETANPSLPSLPSLSRTEDQDKRAAEGAGIVAGIVGKAGIHPCPPPAAASPGQAGIVPLPITASLPSSLPSSLDESPAQAWCGRKAGMAGMDSGPSPLATRNTTATCFAGATGTVTVSRGEEEEEEEEESALRLAREAFPGAVEVEKGDAA